MLASVAVVIFGMCGHALAFLPNMGPCSVNVEPDTSFDLDQWAEESKAGTWSFRIIPNTPDYKTIEWMFLSSNPIADSGVYRMAMFSKDVSSTEPAIHNDIIVFDTGNGIISAKPTYGTGSNVTSTNDGGSGYKMFFLAYEPNSFAYFYVCSDDGANTSEDYRYVVTHKKLTEQQKTTIKNLDSDFGFLGPLKYLVEGGVHV